MLAVLGMIGVVAHPGVVTVDRELGFAFFAALSFFPSLLARLDAWTRSHQLRGLLVNVLFFWCLGFGALTYLLHPVQALLILIPLGVASATIGYAIQRRRTAS
ncbi:hypothetical protein [Kribbella sp. NPDC004536]|uniref:hypothetical protein n=1 Tax=Kribbella sp. NPDC004536 TaxID=3364106 RepID=UPI0036A17E11